MKQVLLTRVGVEVCEVPAPGVQPGCILVRVSHSCISTGTELSGVRDSNVPLWKRAMRRPDQVRRLARLAMKDGLQTARTLVKTRLSEAQPVGYSAVGVAIAVGEAVDDVAIGERIACAGAQSAYHAEVICVPRNLCAPVPDAVADLDAATVTIGAIALQGLRRLQPTLGETIVVVGLGVIGQITVQLLRSAGARVIGIDLDRGRLAEANASGIDVAIHPDDVDPTAQVTRLTDGFGADGVIVTAGSPSNEILSTAFRMCRRKARVVLVGDVGLDIKRADIYAKELDFLVSTSYGPGRYDRIYEEEGLDYPIAYVRWTENRNMSEYLRQVAEGRVKLDVMSRIVVPVERAVEAYAALADPEHRPLSAFIQYSTGARPLIHRIDLKSSRPPVGGVIRLGLIGTGDFAKSMHLPLLDGMRGQFSLQAVASRRGHVAAALARQYGAAVAATDAAAVLDDPAVDAVLIATRHDSHADLVVSALESGKHVLVEKPLCLTRDQLGRIEATVTRLGDGCPILMTAYNRRFSSHVDAVKRLLDQRSNPFMASYRVNAGYVPLDHWVHGMVGGGRNIGEACHFYDLFGYLAGARVVSVKAHAIRPTTAHYARSDNFAVVMTFADGSVANLIYTALGDPGLPKELVDVYCDGRILQILDFRDVKAFGCKLESPSRADKGHAAELAAFARAVRGEVGWPILMWQQIQTMDIAFQVEEQLSAAAGA